MMAVDADVADDTKTAAAAVAVAGVFAASFADVDRLMDLAMLDPSCKLLMKKKKEEERRAVV